MLILNRDIRTETAILGSLFLNDTFICYTLENALKAIPSGAYKLENSNSPKFKRELSLIYNKNVPAKRGIRIHAGNEYTESAGCVLVGMKRNETKGTLSEATNAEIMVTMLCRNNKDLIILECE